MSELYIASILISLCSAASLNWEQQNAHCSFDFAGSCVEYYPHFAEAALWALDLVPAACDTCEESGDQLACDIINCKWEKQPATWRYVFNNLRLAIEAAEPSYRELLPAEIGIQLGELHAFIGELGSGPQMWTFHWRSASVHVRDLLASLRPWLTAGAYKRGPPLAVPRYDHGLQFPLLGRSAQVSTDGNIGTRVVLANGVAMPLLGLGVSGLSSDGKVAYQSVRWALELGYRHIDTAQGYGNEAEVGRAIRDSKLPRKSIFLVTKLSDIQNSSWQTRKTFEKQLEELAVDYIDLYMMHHAGRDSGERQVVWRELEKLYAEGRIRALGVSNFGIPELSEMFQFAKVKPVYIQNKFTIYQPGAMNEAMKDASLMEWLVSRKVMMTGFSIINPDHWTGYYLQPLSDPHVVAIARRVGRTPSQVLHRWVLQLGAAIIPKSKSQERIRENSQVFDFSLAESDMRLLNGLSSLAASIPGRLVPKWCADVYGLSRLSTV